MASKHKKRQRQTESLNGDGEESWGDLLRISSDTRPFWKRKDAKAGLSLHDAMIYYGPDFEAETVATLELGGYGGPPPVGEGGWPPDEEEARDYRINAFRLERCRRTLEQHLLQILRE